ncbi:MAG TPA: sugar ABC transporter permease [Candidatus Mediterraneibacter cottocaccae]|nr:sugar ABC transporter permease [Candidatus Mediterraneibacter cottocaccae]
MNRIDKKIYTGWLAVPGILIYVVIFVVPTFASFYFSMTTWNLKTSVFTGLENFITFFTMTNTKASLINTALYAFFTCFVKVTLGLLIAQYLCKKIKSAGYLKVMLFFPTLLGNVAVAIAFEKLLSSGGIVNQFLGMLGMEPVKFLTSSEWALITCIVIDIWKGIGTAMLIYIAGISAIPDNYYEAAAVDGARPWQIFRKITLPLLVPTINSVLTLSLIGGLRTYDLIYAMTGGGPGYSTEVLGSVIYKLFSRGNYGLATAGYVIMFVIVSVIVFPLNSFVAKREAEL